MTAENPVPVPVPEAGPATAVPPGLPPPPTMPPKPSIPAYGSLDEVGSPSIMNALLKHPGRLAYEIQHEGGKPLVKQAALLAVVCLAFYGLVMGSFAGGVQWFWAPLKVVGGMTACAIICYPSLYIFSCLSGIDVRAGEVCQLLLVSIAMIALLLVGLAPVGWVFSSSIEAVGMMGFLHLLFWALAFFFGMRFLKTYFVLKGSQGTPYVIAWMIIFVMVCLQMSTTLRPIIGESEHAFTSEKRFFIQHWFESVDTGR